MFKTIHCRGKIQDVTWFRRMYSHRDMILKVARQPYPYVITEEIILRNLGRVLKLLIGYQKCSFLRAILARKNKFRTRPEPWTAAVFSTHVLPKKLPKFPAYTAPLTLLTSVDVVNILNRRMSETVDKAVSFQ